jgi:GNAT superfamily N-acetyltransferase
VSNAQTALAETGGEPAGAESWPAVPTRPEVVHLRDGTTVAIRPVRPADEAPLRTFLAGLCPEARRLRFFTGAADVKRAAQWAADTVPGREHRDQYGLLAHDETGALVAHASYAQLDARRAEVAVEVADHLHGRGLGTILIERLAAVAEGRGLTELVAEVLPENREMLDVFRDGFDARTTYHEGIETVMLPTAAWRLARSRFQ